MVSGEWQPEYTTKDRSTASGEIFMIHGEYHETSCRKSCSYWIIKKRVSEFNEQVINGWDNRVICEIVTGTE